MTKETEGNGCQQCKKGPPALPEPLAALREAVLDGRVAEVEELLANGQSVDADFGSGATPMHMAIQEGRVEVVKTLLARGADLTSVTRAGWTPGHMVAFANNVGIAKLKG
jgi:ankyrin repeat protein